MERPIDIDVNGETNIMLMPDITHPEEVEEIVFESDEIMEKVIADDKRDIATFNKAQDKNHDIFINARMSHGNHLDNPEWYDRAELACKCWRYIKSWQLGQLPEEEEMCDLANYSTMINSRR